MHVTRDVVIDEHKLYDRTGVPDELFDEDWKPSDDAEFADSFEMENGPTYPPSPPAFPSRSIHQPTTYLPTLRITPTPTQPQVLPQPVGGPVGGSHNIPGGWGDDDGIGNNGGEDGNGNGIGQGSQGGQNQQASRSSASFQENSLCPPSACLRLSRALMWLPPGVAS